MARAAWWAVVVLAGWGWFDGAEAATCVSVEVTDEPTCEAKCADKDKSNYLRSGNKIWCQCDGADVCKDDGWEPTAAPTEADSPQSCPATQSLEERDEGCPCRYAYYNYYYRRRSRKEYEEEYCYNDCCDGSKCGGKKYCRRQARTGLIIGMIFLALCCFGVGMLIYFMSKPNQQPPPPEPTDEPQTVPVAEPVETGYASAGAAAAPPAYAVTAEPVPTAQPVAAYGTAAPVAYAEPVSKA